MAWVEFLNVKGGGMFKRRRASFKRAHGLLQQVKRAAFHLQLGETVRPQKLTPLRLLQKLLLREVGRCERKIRRTKAFLKAATDDDVRLELEERIASFRHLAYNWRTFGDAIAFAYLDKFALKHTHFNTHNLNAKQDAGFLIEKEGLVTELAMLYGLLDRGVPALLADLTNTIRHGDICLLQGPDPKMIEVKAGELGPRGRRQRNAIRLLEAFFENDEAEGLRGLPRIQRRSPQRLEITHVPAMNQCIAAARRAGGAWCSPEAGLYYLALADERVPLDQTIGQIPLVKPMAFSLNEMKAGLAWTPYSPYTLSIEDEGALFEFIWGDLYLMVLWEIPDQWFLDDGTIYSVTPCDEESDYAFDVTAPDGSEIKLSKGMLQRIALEFTSPEWIFLTAIEKIHGAGESKPASEAH
ncbi:hypothetical protein [Asticcacaulis tiandongensis]|uniref:hypothetical protein n=1 Tax=Asticcacaulis tiandongensis TaxID=2565365 RepID=UPI001129A15D|nr:hypothetical protein [Asticcacaulis tiandongensis]